MRADLKAQGNPKITFCLVLLQGWGRGNSWAAAAGGPPPFSTKESHYQLSLVLNLGPGEVSSKKGSGRVGLCGRVNQTQILLTGFNSFN